MSERKINLEEKFYESFNIYHSDGNFMTKNCFVSTVRDICKQVLELAAENAEILRDDFNCDSQIRETEIVDKQSILNTIKQVE